MRFEKKGDKIVGINEQEVQNIDLLIADKEEYVKNTQKEIEELKKLR